MTIKLAIEWFLNPDHLPFIVAQKAGIFDKYGIDFELIEPDEHYDGLSELRAGTIEFATNEPLHLIEQFDERYLTLGSYFETKGGVLLKRGSFDKPQRGETLVVTTPVSNDVTNAIGFEIIRRYYARHDQVITPEQVEFVPNGFEHIKYMQEGADAGWLYFYNFEGIEAEHAAMEVLYLDAQHAGFPNFSALDIFTSKDFFYANEETCVHFIHAIKGAISLITNDPETAMQHYYDYTGQTRSALMDDIIRATIVCFDPDFRSDVDKALPVLGFFRDLGITALEDADFKHAFLQ